MNIQEVADKLNGIQYGSEGGNFTLAYCRGIVFCLSDLT
jgi:hypothetical protein